MGWRTFDYLPPGEHMRVNPEPADDPTLWPGSYVVQDKGHDIPPRIKEMHEYWEPTLGVQWYQIPRGSAS